MTLVGAWGFGEGTGTTTADSSGNGRTLTLNNATWDAAGHTGSAVTNTAANQGATGTVPSITTAVTMMCWVKPLDLAVGSTHFVCGIMQPNGNTDLAIFTQRGNFGAPNVLQADVRVSGNLTAANGSSGLTVGTWTHVAVTYDGSAIKLYRDGLLVTTVSNAGSISLGTDFYVAGALTAAGVDTDVVTDDVRLYSGEALDQATIATLKDTPVGGTITGTFAVSAPAAAAVLAGQAVVSGALATAAPSGVVSGAGSAPASGQLAAVAPPATVGAAGAAPIAGALAAIGPPPESELDGVGLIAGVLTAEAPSPVVVLRDEGDLQDITLTITEQPSRWLVEPALAHWRFWEA